MKRYDNLLRKAEGYVDQIVGQEADVLSFDNNLPVYKGKSLFPFSYRPYQQKIFNMLVNGDHKKFFLHWPRRSGKDVFSFTAILSYALRIKGLYGYVLPLKTAAKRIIWNGGFSTDGVLYKFRELIPKKLIKRINSVDMTLEFYNGSVIYLVGSENYDRLRGIYLSGVVYSEFAFGRPEGFNVITPVMSQSGGFTVINTTPNGRNFSWQKFKSFEQKNDWYCSIETCETLIDNNGDRYISNTMIQDSINNGLSPGMIRQEFYCEPILNTDTLYFALEIQELEQDGRIKSDTLIPNRTMYFAFDLGISDSTCVIGFQVNNAGHPIVSYYHQNNNQTWTYYYNEIKSYCASKSLPMGTFFLPHDAKKKEGSTLTSIDNIFRNMGANVRVLKRIPYKDSLIEIAKRYLNIVVINQSINELIEALSSYSRDYDSTNKVYKNHPRHDWASHPADAFQYMAQAVAEGVITHSSQSSNLISDYST